MKRSHPLTSLLCLGLLAGAASAGELETRLDAIVARLGDADEAVQLKAEGELSAWCRDAGDAAASLIGPRVKDASDESASRLERCLAALERAPRDREWLKCLDCLQLPSTYRVGFVVINMGQTANQGHATCEFRHGWKLSATQRGVRVLLISGQVVTLKRPPEGWPVVVPDGQKAQPTSPRPGEWSATDLDRYGRERIAADYSSVLRADTWWSGNAEAEKPASAELELLVLARGAFDQGLDTLAVALLQRAREIASIANTRDPENFYLPHRKPGDPVPSPDELLGCTVSSRGRQEATRAVLAGESTQALRDRWHLLEGLPTPPGQIPAADFVKGYDLILAAAKELPPDPLTESPLEKLLRQLLAAPEPETQAALRERFEALGYDALLSLEKYLEDPRPLRAVATETSGLMLANFQPITVGLICEEAMYMLGAERLEESVVAQWFKDCEKEGIELGYDTEFGIDFSLIPGIPRERRLRYIRNWAKTLEKK